MTIKCDYCPTVKPTRYVSSIILSGEYSGHVDIHMNPLRILNCHFGCSSDVTIALFLKTWFRVYRQ